MSTKPNMIINNCVWDMQGNPGDSEYICKNGNYYYIVSHSYFTNTEGKLQVIKLIKFFKLHL